MGQKVVLTESFTDTSIETVYPDKLLSAGSLFLVDLGHSLGGFSGVPATSAVIPNVAYAQAAAVLGSGTSTTLAGSILRNDTVSTHKVERSGKSGLHVIYTASADASGGNKSVSLEIPDLLKSYILANPAHSYYFSVWEQVTRVANTNNIKAGITNTSSPFSNDLFIMRDGSAGVVNGVSGSQASLGTRNALGAFFDQVNTTGGFAATPPPNIAGMYAYMFQVGSGKGTLATAGYYNSGFSSIFYRAYIEDLTVSGRTNAAVLALDQAAYTAAFASGGRFNGDTYTAPSTLP